MAATAAASSANSSAPPLPAPPRPTLAYCAIPDSAAAATHKNGDASLLSLAPAAGSSVGVGHFRGRHLLGIGDLNRAEIDRLMLIADYMAAVVAGPGSCDLAKGCILAALFYEPSTRTCSSFQAAMLRLGGQCIAITDTANSSVSKGESLEDTVRCMQCYCNIIAMRHPETGSALRASKVLDVPLINAGDGIGEHPTQALLDLYTLHNEFADRGHGGIDGLTVTMVGDLKNGRTVHSLCKLLSHFKLATLHLVSPPSLRMPQSVLEGLQQRGVAFKEHESLEEAMKETDVLYVTRVQKERFAALSDYDAVKDSFIITPEMLERLHAKASMRILHPLPRVNELSAELDRDPRAAYFRQMKHGMHVRMAIIAALLGKA